MNLRERAYNKILRLTKENNELFCYIENIERKYYRLTEEYMEGYIDYSIGKEQNRLKKLKDKYKNQIEKNNIEIYRLSQKYGFSL